MADLHNDVKRRLEDAGQTLLMLPMPADGMPAGDRAVWPDTMQRFWDIVGVADKGSMKDRMTALAQARNRTQLHASRVQIERLDEVLGWLWYIQVANRRRVIAARMQVHPLSDRHLYSWRNLARHFHTSARQLRRWHDEGIQDIVDGLGRQN